MPMPEPEPAPELEQESMPMPIPTPEPMREMMSVPPRASNPDVVTAELGAENELTAPSYIKELLPHPPRHQTYQFVESLSLQ